MREAARILVSLVLAVSAALGVAYVIAGVTSLDDELLNGLGMIALGIVLVAIPVRTTYWLRSRQGRPDRD